MKTINKLPSLKEIAEKYSLSLATLRRWGWERRFPIYKISNRIRVSESEFNNWLEKFKIEEIKNDK